MALPRPYYGPFAQTLTAPTAIAWVFSFPLETQKVKGFVKVNYHLCNSDGWADTLTGLSDKTSRSHALVWTMEVTAMFK